MTTIDQTTMTATEKVEAAFDFEIVKMPLSGPDNMTTPYFGLFRDDTCEVVSGSSVTSRYKPHQTEDVVALVRACESVFGDSAKVTTNFDRGHNVIIAPSNEFRRSIYGTEDNIFPRLIIKGNYDKKAFSASMGMYRDACLNLAMLQSVQESRQTIKHTTALTEKLEDLKVTFRALQNTWEGVEETALKMEDNRVNMVDFLNEIYGDPSDLESTRAINTHKKRTEAILTRLMREQRSTGRDENTSTRLTHDHIVSGWMAFNAVQGYHQHNATRRGEKDPVERALMALEAPQVAKAEALALA